jgi:hypothetical protein
MGIQKSVSAISVIDDAQFSAAVLRRFPSAPRPAGPIFLVGVVDIILVLISAVFLGIAPQLRTRRPQRKNSPTVCHRSLA